MIVKMRKVTLMVMNKHSADALSKLRKLGVVHIKHIVQPSAHGITALRHHLEGVEKALFILSHFKNDEKKPPLKSDKITGCVKNVLVLDKERETLISHLEDLRKDLEWFQEWGDVASSTLTDLNQHGVFVKLYKCSKSFLKNLPREKEIYVLGEDAGGIKIALITNEDKGSLNLNEIKLPAANLHSVQRKIITVEKHLEDIKHQLTDAAGNRTCLVQCREDLKKKIDFFCVKFGMAHENVFSCLQGFVPILAVNEVKHLADKEGWGYIFEQPDDVSEVPTFIKNPRWLEIISPVFKFMGVLPGYKEIDISLWFLVFFSLFFAMLIGDAGYGVIFLILTVFARKKFSKFPAAPFFLAGLLSCATILWGAVTGTWFGVEEISFLPVFSWLVIDRMDSFVAENQSFMMYLCFLVGVIQLTFAHIIKAVRYINSWAALGQVGWIGILWGLFFLIGKFVLNNPLPEYFFWLMISGIGLVILFSNPRKNIIKGQLIALGNLPLSVINSFADILSYLRLFVIGYVSVMVAASFNEMAMRIGFNSIFSGLGAGLILFFGHALNISLGLLAVLVHGIRLNMLEFSSHLDIQWSGREYRPFRE